MKKVKRLALSLLCLSSSLVAVTLPQSALARPSFPITRVVFLNGQIAEFVVPDQNTTVNAGGGLRRYDAHIAKMFELTLYECQDSNQPDSHQIAWNYRAGGGDIEMGTFNISCALARNLVAAYGLGQPEPTEVFYYRVQDVINVPKFNIVGGKVATWRRFTPTFRPVSTATNNLDVIRSLVKQAVQPAIPSIPFVVEPIYIVSNYAIASYSYGETGGQGLLKRENGRWRVLTTSGGSIQEVGFLTSYGVPRAIAQELAAKR